MHWMLRIANGCVWCAALTLAAAPLPRLYTAENYDVSIQPDLAKQRLSGEVKIRFHSLTDIGISALELDAGGLQVTSVLEGQAPQSYEQDHGMLFVVLTNSLFPDQHRTITVRYQAGPAPGLKFFPDQVYGSVTTDWLPCNDLPGERARLHLTLSAPPDTKAAASGQLTATRNSNGQSITEWQLDSPASPSWFGFALGRFAENTSDAESVKLRALGANAAIFEPTAAAIHYLADRTAKPYPGQTYTQVFVHGDQSCSFAAGLTLLPESYAEGLAKRPGDLWLLADELAHQWYGVGIASMAWTDTWLSEGISAYLADAFLGQRLGKASYEQEIARSLESYNQIRGGSKDRPLSDPRQRTRPKAGDEIPAHKGVCFLHLLNQMVGDNAFWNGMRRYTAGQWGQAATSEDLQKAFDAGGSKGAASKRKKKSQKGPQSLDDLFDLWVYGIPTA